MEVIIQKEGSFTFEPNYKFKFASDRTASTGNHAREVYIPAVQVTKELLDRLISAGLTPNVKVGQSIAGLQVIVGFKAPSGPGTCEGSVELVGSAQFLSSLFGWKWRKLVLEEAKIKLEVTKITSQGMIGSVSGNAPAGSSRLYGDGQHFVITPTGQSPLFNCGHREAKGFVVRPPGDSSWFDDWTLYNSEWTIFVAVKLVLSQIFPADPAVQDHLVVNRRMLTDELLADTKVIAQNGAEIKFHRSILAAHSAAFERMFHTKMQEATTGVLELPDMSEESVRALKKYLYVWELKAPQENSLVCFELFEVGHKYGINPLEKATSKILLSMDGAWYSALVGLRLFLFVKDTKRPRMKRKVVEVLKLKRAELKRLDEYRDLFRKENAAVAMELTECLASP